jgi:hypothetical protein
VLSDEERRAARKTETKAISRARRTSRWWKWTRCVDSAEHVKYPLAEWEDQRSKVDPELNDPCNLDLAGLSAQGKFQRRRALRH